MGKVPTFNYRHCMFVWVW